MLFIVWYHLLLKFIVPIDSTPIYKAMYMPLHVAVICFVLISGFFHIKPSLKGIAKLLFPILVFYLPLTVFEIIKDGGGFGRLFFLSKSPYWFIRTYFYLFLITPILNSFLISARKRLFLLAILGFISVYMGWLMSDHSMADGKNLVLFMFLYVLGDCLKFFKERTEQIETWIIIVLYLILNALLVLAYITFCDSFIGKAIWKLSFPYCSPILILNAVLLFLIVGRFHFNSNIVNWLAGSVFAVYILHHQHYILYCLIKPCTMFVYGVAESPLELILVLGLMSIGFIIIFILVDKLFSPIHNSFLRRASFCEERLRDKLTF